MNAVRNPTTQEREEVLKAIASRDGEQLRKLVLHQYSDVAWGLSTENLPYDDVEWMTRNLEPEHEETSTGYWGA